MYVQDAGAGSLARCAAPGPAGARAARRAAGCGGGPGPNAPPGTGFPEVTGGGRSAPGGSPSRPLCLAFCRRWATWRKRWCWN